MGHVVFSFTILVISFISDGVIPPKLSTIQNKSAMPFIFSNLSKKPSYSFHLDIYIVLNPTSNPNFFISVASITARSKLIGSTAILIMSTNPIIGNNSVDKSSGLVLFSLSIIASFFLLLFLICLRTDTGE